MEREDEVMGLGMSIAREKASLMSSNILLQSAKDSYFKYDDSGVENDDVRKILNKYRGSENKPSWLDEMDEVEQPAAAPKNDNTFADLELIRKKYLNLLG